MDNTLYSIQNGVLSINEGTNQIPDGKGFPGNMSINKVILPEGLESIGYDAFRYCKNLESIEFPSSLKYINHNAFNGCEKLSRVVFPAGLEKIGAFAFQDCKQLEEIIITDSVTEIMGGAFQGCCKLAKVSIGCGVKRIQRSTFKDCKSLSRDEIKGSDDLFIDFSAFL